MVKISVLVPCYNVEKYLSTCLDSILNQTLSDIEIICINDGSTDNTSEILKSYSRKDTRVKILLKSNSGYGDSMNRALDIASGEYIGIVESDDFIEPDMYQILYLKAKEFDLDISRACYFEYKFGKDYPVYNEWVPKNIVHNPNENYAAFAQAPSIWCAIYRRSWLNENLIRFLPTPGASYQDTSFAFKCYACCKRLLITDKPLLHYRLDNEASSVNNPGKVFCVCDEWREIFRFVRSDKRRFAHLFSIMPELQFSCYKWNYRRLSSKFRTKFLLFWLYETLGHIFRGEISVSWLWSKRKCLSRALYSFFR